MREAVQGILPFPLRLEKRDIAQKQRNMTMDAVSVQAFLLQSKKAYPPSPGYAF